MSKQTPLKRVLFHRGPGRVWLVVFVALLSLVTLTSVILAPRQAFAATNSTLNFQARLENATGSIVPDGNYNIQFKLYNVSTAGSALWTETYLVNSSQGVTVKNGYVSVSLGSITAFPSTINWDQDLYLTMNIGGTANTATPTYDGEMSPRLHLTAVPYAFRAGQLAQYNGATGFTSTLSLLQPTGGNQTFQVADQGAAGTYTLLTQNAANTSFIQNQNASAQTTSNFWISGTGRADTALTAPRYDTALAGTLTLGDTNATAVTLGKTAGTTNINTTINGTASFKPNSDSPTAFAVQNASSQRLLTVDTSGARVTVGQSSTLSGSLLFANAANANVITVTPGTTSASYTLTLPTALGASGSCLKDTTGAGVLGFAACGGVAGVTLQATTPGTADTGNFNITGTGIASILQAGTFDTASSVALNIGTTNASAINLGTNAVAHAIGIGNATAASTVSIQGGTGASAITLSAGSGGTISVGAGGVASTIQIGNTTGAVAQTLNLGNNATASSTSTLNIGSQIGTSATNISAGTGNINLQTNTSNLAADMVRLVQGGTADAAIEFNNSGIAKSFYVGQDTSTSGNFVINSSTSASGGSLAAITHVQTVRAVYSGATAVTSVSRAFVSNNTAGNFIAVTFTYDTTTAASFTCSDSRGNTYNTAVVRNDLTYAQQTGICYAMNIAAGANTVTVTTSVARPYFDVSASEYSGVATTNALDVTASNLGTGGVTTDDVTSSNGITSQSNELIFGAVRATTNATTLYTAGTSFNQRDNGTSYQGYQVEDRIQSGAGSAQATFSSSLSSNYEAVMATFKAAYTSGPITDTFTTPLFALSQTGSLSLTPNTDSTNVFQIQNAGGSTKLFNIDSSNKVVGIGSSVTDTTQVNLQLDSSSNFTDSGTCSTTVNQGALYYNTSSNTIRTCVNATWDDVVTTSGLGIIAFGIIPDSPATTGTGDLAGANGYNSGPCKVYVTASVNVIGWNSCIAYSGGRKVLIAAGTATVSASTSVYQNLCVGSSGVPALVGTANATETTAGLFPAFAVGAPTLCLATIKTATKASNIAAIYDTRTYTTSTKTFATIATAVGLGAMVKQNGVVGQYAPTAAATDQIAGVVVAFSGTTSTTVPNAVIVTNGPVAVKATSGTVAQIIDWGAAVGYGTSLAVATTATNPYVYAGVAQNSYAGVAAGCSASSACSGSLFTNLMIR